MASQYKTTFSAYRIADIRHPIFSGEGAQRFGGRWNKIGQSAIYGALHLSCAMLELMVHLNDTPIPDQHHYITITSTKKLLVDEVQISDFKFWDLNNTLETQDFGSKWLTEQRSVALIVPSIIIPIEQNIIINPSHPDCKNLEIASPKPLKWDSRLF